MGRHLTVTLAFCFVVVEFSKTYFAIYLLLFSMERENSTWKRAFLGQIGPLLFLERTWQAQ